MPDHFTLLHEPRRPWLDADVLKEKFHSLAAAHHPDVARDATVDFAALNAAYNTLRDPRARLRHLLELEFPDTLSRPRQISADLGAMFMQLGALRQTLDAFLKKQAQASSPIAQALLAQEKMSLHRDLEKWLAVLDEKHTRLLDEIKAIDDDWQPHKPELGERLAEIDQRFSYLSKWGDQLRDGMLKLGG